MQRLTRFKTIFLILAILLVAGVVVAKNKKKDPIKRAVLKIDSLSCGGCFTTINASLSPLKGYSGMGANLWRKLVAVDFTAPLTAEVIAKTVTDSGYPAKLEYVDDIQGKESFKYLESRRRPFAGASKGECCSGGGYPGQSNQSPQSNPLPSIGGSCCPAPSVPQKTKNL